MRRAVGDIWDYTDNMKVIPTNIGWRVDGHNVMGRGLAKQARMRYPGLSQYYGFQCQLMSRLGTVNILTYKDLILFPVKPLNKIHPQLSWRQMASLELIEISAKQLGESAPPDTVIPLVGCGNGRLSEEDVLPILEKYLDDRFILIENADMYRRVVV